MHLESHILQIKGIDIHSSPDRQAGSTSPTDAETLSAQPRFKTPSDTVSGAVVRRDASGDTGGSLRRRWC